MGISHLCLVVDLLLQTTCETINQLKRMRPPYWGFLCFGYALCLLNFFFFFNKRYLVHWIGAKRIFSIFSFSLLLYGITTQAQPKGKYDLCSQVSLRAHLPTVALWQRGIDLLEEGKGTTCRFGTLSIIKICGLLYFLAYFSAQNPNGVEQCKSEKLSWV